MPADAAADDHAAAVRSFFFKIDAGIFDRADGGGDAELAKAIQPLGLSRSRYFDASYLVTSKLVHSPPKRTGIWLASQRVMVPIPLCPAQRLSHIRQPFRPAR